MKLFEERKMEERTLIKLDLTGCKSSYDIHIRIQKAFDFPDWYGKHWDAFRDLLMGLFVNTDVEIVGHSTLPEQLDAPVQKMLAILQEKKEEMEEMNLKKPEFGYRFEYAIVD